MTTKLRNGAALGVVCLCSLVLSLSAIAQVTTPIWRLTGRLNIERYGHTATLLANGKVLVAAGAGYDTESDSLSARLDSAEVYEPSTGTWSMTGRLNSARYGHTATLLPDGRVLVVGGTSGTDLLANAELYQPDTGSWTRVTSLTSNYGPNSGHTATLLQSGKVLIAGGMDSSGRILNYSSLYDPVTGGWSETGRFERSRALHRATTLQDGRILVTGGVSDSIALAIAEIYDVQAGTWSKTGAVGVHRAGHSATLLPDGRVLVAGDSKVAELFDPETNEWHATAGFDGRFQHTASLRSDGTVLMAGGSFGNVLDSTVQYDIARESWEYVRPLIEAREEHTATLLRDNRILVAGGFGAHSLLRNAELYDAPAPMPVIEYRNTMDFPESPGGHFFYTADLSEQALVDTGSLGQFVRTGQTFKSGGSKQLCRFYGSTVPGPNAHFFSISDQECHQLRSLQRSPPPPGVQQWNYEGMRFAEIPAEQRAAGSSCPAGTLAVFRAYNNAYPATGPKNPWDSMHRFSTNHADIQQLVTEFAWRDEGIAFCSPQ